MASAHSITFRDQEQARARPRRALLVGFALVGFADHGRRAGAGDVLDGRNRVRQRLDAGGIHSRICSTMSKNH